MEYNFGQRLLEKRKEAKLSRSALSKLANISDRTILNYENGSRYPNSLDIVKRLADSLGTTSTYLLGEESSYIIDAKEKGGTKSARDIRSIVEEVTGLFAGGELPQEDKDALMRAFSEAYFLSKEENQKYTPKKYKSNEKDHNI